MKTPVDPVAERLPCLSTYRKGVPHKAGDSSSWCSDYAQYAERRAKEITEELREDGKIPIREILPALEEGGPTHVFGEGELRGASFEELKRDPDAIIPNPGPFFLPRHVPPGSKAAYAFSELSAKLHRNPTAANERELRDFLKTLNKRV